ncbi:23S rRNA m(5)U-1939 methyltransferase [Keratinibaculum paraultunense]|uniref:23S rRNA m(5)U-1939 methyltransferase n=1 Tax=Keratinibaculum paraultunense TaxID=1278232 RepID=A0A4R3KU23_9FIRM|nr:23S rRNA (uracil(1939)-C(5))-methyltransferase RlmD [Keratinibaculum paraultunense]QQY79089.1 23S rRNA (uracil(1939)-C(5))-methyltransferase RlmD [Keratinibaculum paraultunense]TCS88470.1 23S rRNA m(5)U-1939 methyltransferase [Keratinibaculum paraultunense]
MKQFKIGDEIILDIIDINSEGQGVGKYEGFTLFINGGTLGDKVRVKIIDLKKSFGIANTIELLEKSPYRVEPKCKYFHSCDGCQLQNLNYQKQLELKQDMVKNNIKKIGNITNVPVKKIIGMNNPYRYRNKGEFKVGKDCNIGYFKKGTHEIYPIDKCIIQNEAVNEIVELVREHMKKYKLEGYDTKTKEGIIRNIIVRITKDNKVMVIIVTKEEKLPYKEKLIDILINKDRSNNYEIKSIYQNINKKDTSVVLGSKNIKLYGEDRIVDCIGEYKFFISPKSFFQVNPIQTEILYNKVLEYANLKGDEIVFDIYCGIGTISLFLAKKAKEVYGVEIVKSAIEDAKLNAKINNINNAKFYTGKGEDVVPRLYKEGLYADIVVVDPPRKGCEESVLETMVNMAPEKIIYVSCNPAILARDLAYLVEGGYKVVEVQPVDMFPQTTHVEVVTLLIRNEVSK